MQVGDRVSWERTFTEEDVRLFAQISGDQGVHHIAPDSQGRLMVHGLLTATLPTKLGGDLNYIARELFFEFLRPVFVGDLIRCETELTDLRQDGERIQMTATFVCFNQHKKAVLKGHTRGIIRDLPSALQ